MMCWCSYPDLKPPSPVISSFGAFSGYKINFAKSEAMPLGSLLTVPVTTVPFPFRGLLLGLLIYIRVSPSYQLFKLNFVPLFDSIKADLSLFSSTSPCVHFMTACIELLTRGLHSHHMMM